jgi:hypothetical protein
LSGAGGTLGTAEAGVIKSRAAKGKAKVTFTIDPRVDAQAAAVCGEWNDWSADAGVMHRDAEGGFSVTVGLDAGRAYRFRYLLDGHRWDNDWAADAYVRNDFGGDDSVVDLTALAEAVPPAARRTPAKRAAPAQTAKKTAAPAKQDGKTAAPAKRDGKTAAPAKQDGKTAAPAKQDGKTTAPAKQAGKTTAPAKQAGKTTAPAKQAGKPAK